MCRQCWEDEYGGASVINEKTIAAAKLITDVYEINSVGGALHVVLDDWNIEDEFFGADSFKGYLEYTLFQFSAYEVKVQRKCFDAMAALTVEGRASALALHDGYIREVK